MIEEGDGWNGEIPHLDGKIDLLLALQLAENGEIVGLQQPRNVPLDEIRQLLLVPLEPLQALDRKQGLLPDKLLAPPQRPARPPVVERAPPRAAG